jgi:ribosome-associated protein
MTPVEGGARARDDGSVALGPRLTIPAEEIEVRVTTSGGPGGQHANRSLTRVVVTFRVADSAVLSGAQKARLSDALGPVVRSSASRFRSQRQNRRAALSQLGERIAEALAPRTPRRATRPTKGAERRRLDEKKARGRLKEQRRRPGED